MVVYYEFPIIWLYSGHLSIPNIQFKQPKEILLFNFKYWLVEAEYEGGDFVVSLDGAKWHTINKKHSV